MIIAATTCPKILVSEEILADTKHKLLIDLAMPRNIAPTLSSTHTLLNIDTFSQITPLHKHIHAYNKAKSKIKEAVQRQTTIFFVKTCPLETFCEKKAI